MENRSLPWVPRDMQARLRPLVMLLRDPQEAEISTALREEIRSDRATPERKLAICVEAASLAPEDRIEPLCILAADSDAAVREKAAGVLQTQTVKNVLAALARPGGAPE